MLSEKAKSFIGKSDTVKTYIAEKGAIQRFADAIDDPNPLYWNEEYARKSRYGSVIAPPGFFGWPSKPARGSALNIDIPAELVMELEKAGYLLSNALDGGIEYEFLQPVHAGDILSATPTVKNIRERMGQAGGMVFIILQMTYRNQNGDLVATSEANLILRSN
jgi:acyl dehydratase